MIMMLCCEVSLLLIVASRRRLDGIIVSAFQSGAVVSASFSSSSPNIRRNIKRSLSELLSVRSGDEYKSDRILDDDDYYYCDTYTRTPFSTTGKWTGNETKPIKISNEIRISTKTTTKSSKFVTMPIKGDRRIFFASTLLTAGMAIAPPEIAHASVTGTTITNNDSSNSISFPNLKYKTSPVNKRNGITVFDVEEKGYYNVQFVTFLSRFLIHVDADCQRWWTSTAATYVFKNKITKSDAAANTKIDAHMRQSFGAFSASVEVGLQEYEGKDGPRRLLKSLVKRYCTIIKDTSNYDTTPSSINKHHREVQEARRQLALLFGLLDNEYQPVEEITKLLAAVDNACIERVIFLKADQSGNKGAGGYGGSYYAEGEAPPRILFPEPDAGEGFERASGRANMGPTGRILRVDLVHTGGGYKRAPSVWIAPPASKLGRAATARAILTRDVGSDDTGGRSIERIVLTDGGDAYSADEPIKVTISAPDGTKGGTSAMASGKAIREYKIVSVDIVAGGSGYAIKTAIPVYVEQSLMLAAYAGNNVNGTLESQPTYLINAPFEVSPGSIKSNEAGNDADINERAVLLSTNGKSVSRTCTGRTCFDNRVSLSAIARSEYDLDKDFWLKLPYLMENDVELERYATISDRFVSGTTTGYNFKDDDALGEAIPSSQLLNLIPNGYGLEVNDKRKRYEWAFAPDLIDLYSNDRIKGITPNRPMDPDFGPRGRSPIEKLKDYDLETSLRFTAAGALCSSGAHLILTPIDVVKTKMQVDSSKYTDIVTSFQKVMEEENGAFFTGWAPTFAGYFAWGGTIFTVVELVRRYLTDYLSQTSTDMATFEVPIIIFASSLSAVFGALVICPFEAVRIRTVSRPDFGANVIDVTKRMVKVGTKVINTARNYSTCMPSGWIETAFESHQLCICFHFH